LFKKHQIDVRSLPSNQGPGRDQPFNVEVQPQPRRTRTRRLKEESDRPQRIDAETPPILASPQLPMLLSPPDPVRLDSPEQVARLSPVIRRWAYWKQEEDESERSMVALSESGPPESAAIAPVK
jgi:hypothetical protein